MREHSNHKFHGAEYFFPTRRVACSGRILGSRLWLCLALRWDMQVSSLLLFGLLSVIFTIMRRRSVLQACAKDALLEPLFDVS